MIVRRTAAAVSLFAAAAGCSDMKERFKPLAVGDAVPAYAAKLLDGDSARVGPGTTQPLTLLNVWATWCVPCQKEFPDLQKIHTDYSRRGLRVLGVSIDSDGDVERIREFAKRYSATFPIAHDPGGSIREVYQSLGIPESYLISPDGKLLFRNPGAFPEGAANIRAAIEAALPK
ncbi:MAG TPA: TlpA disulfide reductase family protein [Gemmatimonadaceae bacterium]|nr:TlpA disulfide reductase family protein [Gemmatimonadaceae bacterium]